MAICKIKDIAEEISVRVNDPKSSGYQRFVGLEHYIPGNCIIRNFGSAERLDSAVKEFKSGDILIARRNVYLKRAGIVYFDGVTSGDSIVLRAKTKLMQGLLPFILNTDKFWSYANQNADGSMSKRLSPKLLMDFEFSLPENIDKNEELADILWKMESLREAYETQVKASDDLVKSQFIEMFGTLNTTSYPVMRISELCEFVKDGTHQTPEYTDDKENGYIFLSSKDVVSGEINWDKVKYIPEKLHKELYSRLAPQRGDILLAKNGTTGIAAIVDVDLIFDIYVSLALLRFKAGNNIKYLLYAINSVDSKRQFDKSLKGIGVPNLHLGEIKNTKLIIPPIEFQNEFARFVEQTDKSKFEIKQSIENLTKMQKALINEVFA